MALLSSDLQYLIDRAAVQDVLARYFHGIDGCDHDRVRSCFTDDVETHYALRPPTRGIEALMESLQTARRIREGSMKVSTHFMGNFNLVRLEGDTARTEINAIAFLVEPGTEGDVVVMRSLRYFDRLRRHEDGWRICHRVHTLDWSCRVPANFAVTAGQRLAGSSEDERATGAGYSRP
jgi:ketosteroid isomerase-like protein